MIDLRQKGLPDAIEVDGKLFYIKTNFRDWLKFGEIVDSREFKDWIESDFVVENGISFRDFFFLFDGEIPRANFITNLLAFYINPNETPHDNISDKKDIQSFDYIRDGEYIVGSFMQAYHINLTEIEYMHWHMFKALFVCLPGDTMIKEIMSMRTWNERDDKRKYEEHKRKLREVWELPKKNGVRDIEILEEINKEFYNAV